MNYKNSWWMSDKVFQEYVRVSESLSDFRIEHERLMVKYKNKTNTPAEITKLKQGIKNIDSLTEKLKAILEKNPILPKNILKTLKKV